MGTLTLRFPEKLDQQLTQLAEQSHLNRSEVARAALDRGRFGEFPLGRLTPVEMRLVEQRLMLMFGIFIPAQSA
jgi:hypothetical protein